MPMNYQKLYLSACGISLISLIATNRGDDCSHSNMLFPLMILIAHWVGGMLGAWWQKITSSMRQETWIKMICHATSSGIIMMYNRIYIYIIICFFGGGTGRWWWGGMMMGKIGWLQNNLVSSLGIVGYITFLGDPVAKYGDATQISRG